MAGFVEYDFIKRLSEERRLAYQNEDDKRIGQLKHIENILASIKNRILITNDELLEIQWKDYQGIRLEKHEALLLQLTDQISGTGASTIISDLEIANNLSDLYFIHNRNSDRLTQQYGIIAEDSQLKQSVFWRETAINQDWQNWSDYSKFNLPSNAMVIIDPYIFTSVEKLESLLELLNICVPQNISHFQLTIISALKEKVIRGKRIIERSLQNVNKFRDAFLKMGIQYDIILLDSDFQHLFPRNQKLHDREIITNYASLTFGLPFMGKTKYSQLFIGAMDNAGTCQQKKIRIEQNLKTWKTIIDKVPIRNRKTRRRHRWKSKSSFTNRLFDNL